MKKKLISFVIIYLIIFTSSSLSSVKMAPISTDTNKTITQNTNEIIAEKSFLQKFIEALKANDQIRMEEIVKQTKPHIIYDAVISQARMGITSVAEGKDGSMYFNTAEAIAALYAKEFEKDALLELIRKYKVYTQAMSREKFKGEDFHNEGISLYLKGQLQEALDLWTTALKIFGKIGDAAREAKSLVAIGLVYDSLGQYSEALEYHQKSLEIARRIGDVAGEAAALGNIGTVYSRLGQYSEALDYYQQSLEIAREIGDVAGEAIILSNIGNVYSRLGQYSEALNYYQQSLEIARRIGDVAGEARTLSNVGVVYYSQGQNSEALSYYQQSLEIAREIGDVAGEAKALNNIGLVYYSLGQYSEALDYYQQSLEIDRRIGDVAGEAAALGNIGTVYSRLGQYNEALDYYQQSLDIDREIGDVAGEVKALNNIGVVYYSLRQYSEALSYYQQSLEIKREIGDVAGEAAALGNIGIVYSRLGQYSVALNYHQKALDIARRIGDVAGEAADLGNIGLIYFGLGQYSEALDYYQQSLDIDREIGDVAGEAADLGNIGNVYHSLGQYSEALSYYQQSLDISRRIGDVAGEAADLGNIGLFYDGLGQYSEALSYYQQSLDISRRIGDVAGEAAALTNIGRVYFELGQYNKAIEVLQESIKISEQLGELETMWRGHGGLGIALWKSGKGEEAVNSYKKAVKTIEDIYGHTSGLKEEERLSMIGEKSFIYQEFIKLLLELHDKHPDKGYDRQAFTVSEKAKSRIFQELMAKARARTVFVGDETFQKIVEKEQQLVGELSNLQSLLTKELSKPEKERNNEVIDSQKEQLSKAEKSLSELEIEIEAEYPRYTDLKRPKPLSVKELQETLKPDETILTYSVGKDKSAAFVLGKERFKLVELAVGREELAELIGKFRKGLDNVKELTIDLEKFDPAISYTLYQKIFQPISEELKGITRLYFTADDLLYTLPFEALVDRPFDPQAFEEARKRSKSGKDAYLSEYGSLHYLLDTYNITYLPSVSVLRSLRQYPKPGYGQWSKPLIAFADPIFSPEEETEDKKEMLAKNISIATALAARIITRSTGSDPLPRLKASGEEAKIIAGELKGIEEDIYLRDKATEENVHVADLKAARYLLFSTHGLIGGDFSGVAEPALVLTLVGNPPGRDGFLTMSEVLGQDINAEAVILSACNTYGKGEKAGKGEGFAGLTRSFMYAGAKSLLVTHWSIESQAARDLMIEMFRGIKEGLRHDEALRNAKLKMRNSTFAPSEKIPNWIVSRSHPYFWAPFVLVGER